MTTRPRETGMAKRGGEAGVGRREVRGRRGSREQRAAHEAVTSVLSEQARLGEQARPRKFASYVCRVCNRQGHRAAGVSRIVRQYQVDVETTSRDEEDGDEFQIL
ncbi:uncharacterized protein LOC111353901 [Spodoptera litura]|uniref:Uncharacterized protein LOC111353901 n=1 Tax=Spodoptera litura TaxID=69820 RepID=A0A9J7E622_SPOLT|nr:uncharacterized protein LOC111353901 [Spodoptera litura]